MHSESTVRSLRILAIIISLTALAGCGQGSGPTPIAGTPAPPVVDPPANCDDSIDFEDACGPFVFTNFDGGVSTILDNPDASGINVTDKVVQMQKFAGEVWGGSSLDLGGMVDWTKGSVFKMKVWSPRPADVLFKLEGLEQERPGIHTGSSSWEEVCFDFTGSTGGPDATAISVIFDLGTLGDADNDPDNWTFYYDGIEQVDDCGGTAVDYELVFSDEFDSGTAPDPAKWNIETGYGPNGDGWGNNEWQQYANTPENVRVEGGNLVLSALCPNGTCGVRDGTITSGKINSEGKFDFKFGKVEARIQVPVGEASWPAFWSLGANFPTVGWPHSGEIDFMEVHNFYSDENTTHFSMHWCDDSIEAPAACTAGGGWVYDTQFRTMPDSLGDDFHVFSAEWDETAIVGKIDGQVYFTKAIDPDTMEEFLSEFFMIFNVAMGGTLGSGDQPPNGTETFPQTMLVDYVRVYQVAGSGGGGGFPITFDDPGTTYTLTGFGGADDSTVQNDPVGGTNQVARVIKSGTAETWAGTTVSTGANESIPTIPLDAANTQMTVRVYSPDAGIPVRLKIEDASDNTISVETEATTTVAGAWETLTFDFANEVAGTAPFNPANTYNKATIFFNFGVDGATAGEKTYYFDDIDVVTAPGGGGGGDLPITFDDPGTTYTLTGFGGADDSSVQSDPAGGANQVGRVIKSGAAETWAGTTVSTGANESIPTIPLDAANTQMSVRVYSPDAGIPVRLKIEDAADNTVTVETEATTTVANAWETLTFDFANEATGTAAFNPASTYNKVSIFFNFGTDGATAGEKTYFFDDIDVVDGTGGGGGTGVSTDFESPPYPFTDFDGGVATVIANPDMSGLNPSAQVAQMQKFAGQTWGGSTLDLGGAVDWSAGEIFTMKVRASRVVDVLLKLEGLDQERTATHGGTGWEELCFDFTGTTGGAPATAITLIFDNGTMGDAGNPDPAIAANWTFQFDDIQQTAVGCPTGGGGGGDFTTITFDDAGTTYTLTDFGGTGSTVTNDPAGGTNMVVQTVKSNTAETWAGTTVSTGANESIPAIPLDAANTQMSVRVYSPDVGTPVRLKIESASDNTITVETEATTTVAGAWETLTFDFANEATGTAAFNPANTYDKVSIFFNFGTDGATAGEKTYYFDDIDVVAGTGGGGGGGSSARALTDFEDAGAPYTFSDFDGGVATVVDNPDVSGIDVSAKVAQMEKFAGQPWGGSTLDMGGDVDWSGGEVWTMKVRSSRVVPVLFKWEGLDQERSVDHGGTGWEELCFDFTGTTGGAAATALTLIFDLGVVGDAAGDPANWTFQFDDIAQVASCPGGGGGGGGSGSADIDFEAGGAGAGYTWSVFENVDNPPLEIIANPVSGGINTSATVAMFTARQAGAPWAGVESAHGDIGPMTLDATNSIVKIMVYKSVISDVGVKFAIANGGAQPEIKVANTLINQWEELTFDFTGNIGLVESIDIDQIIVFGDFDLAGRTQENIVYFDNIAFTDGSGGGGGGTGVSTDFESPPYPFSDFDGGVATVIANPDMSGLNPSAQVAQMQKFAGQTWGGSTLDLGGDVDWSAGEFFTMKVRASRVVDVLLKLEGLNQERTATHGGTGWEELCFDFTGTTGGAPATAITLIFDNGTMGDAGNADPDIAANWTFQFDDIQQTSVACPTGGGGGESFTTITFDDAGTTYTLTDFGGTSSTVTNDPAGGTNMVVQTVKSNTAETWAGTTVSTGANESIPAIPLDAANTQMSVRVYSPDVGIPVRLKIESATDNTITVETEATTTVAGAWEALTFDFANEATGTAAFNPANIYDKVSIFFNFGTDGATAGEKTYYFDDIDVVAGTGGGGGTDLTDFEGAPGSYVFTDFDGGAATIIANPVAGGINTSAQVGQMLKFAGQPWGGSTLTLDAAVDIPAGTVITLKVWSQRAVPVLFKLEGMNVERSVNHSGSGWEELSYDFTGDSGAGVTDITLIFDLGVVGDAAGDPANWTFYFDDMLLPEAGGGGGGGGGGSSGTGDIDFEAGGAGAGFTWSVFENVDNPPLGIIANPVSGGINTSATVAMFTARQAGAPWAGVETAHGDIGPLTLDATNSIIKVMVYKSVISDVGVKFAIANGGAQPEIKVANTLINQWEELTFDFTGNIGLVESIDIDQIIIFGDFDLAGRTQENIVYFDNIAFTDGS